MPIYEYRCQECEHQFDALQKISDDVLVDCPACGKPALKKMVSAPNFRLKGGGWYETDFKTDKDKKRNLADSGKAADGGSGDAGSAKAGSGEAKSTKTEAKSDTSKSASKKASGDGGKAA